MTDVLRAMQMERNLARLQLQEVKQSVAAAAMASAHALQELRATTLRDRSANEVSLCDRLSRGGQDDPHSCLDPDQ